MVINEEDFFFLFMKGDQLSIFNLVETKAKKLFIYRLRCIIYNFGTHPQRDRVM